MHHNPSSSSANSPRTHSLGLADGQIHQLVVWVPAAVPADDEGKQRDPFAVFAEIGAVFPHGDGDDYASLCRQAKPDHIPEINRLFEEAEPSFEMVDALDEGGSWPKLKTLLGANSSKEILLGILSPKAEQDAALKTDATWVTEAREFVQRILGSSSRPEDKPDSPSPTNCGRSCFSVSLSSIAPEISRHRSPLFPG